MGSKGLLELFGQIFEVSFVLQVLYYCLLDICKCEELFYAHFVAPASFLLLLQV